jgi:GT2 family glycosyltransferase
VVVDNRSTDGSIEWLHLAFPQVEARIAKSNDYLFSLNEVAASRTEDVVVILNNDLHFDEKFLCALLPHFVDGGLFAATAKVMDWEGSCVTMGLRIGEIRRFWFYNRLHHNSSQFSIALDAGGACAAYRRSMFLELGGFDPLYHPAYWEDADLSYRAWLRGLKIVFEPASIVYHRSGGTWQEATGRSRVIRLKRRNEVLFTTKNVGSWLFVLVYLGLLPLRVIRDAFLGRHAQWRGMLDAVPRIPTALWGRFQQRQFCIRSDSDFLAEIKAAADLADPRKQSDSRPARLAPC